MLNIILQMGKKTCRFAEIIKITIMASRRNLKKDINYLTGEVISDCFAYMFFNPDKNQDKVVNIIEDTASSRNELIAKICQSKIEKDPKKLKAYFSDIKKSMASSVDNSFQNLSKLVK